jgi:hypothetical protein
MRKAYLAFLALFALICAASSALAVSNTGTTSFAASVGGSISVTAAPNTLDFGTIATGVTETETNDIKVVCNVPAGYSLTVASNDANGKMVDSVTSEKLSNPVLVTVGALSGATVTTTAATVVAAGVKNNPTGTTITGSYSQTGAATDPAGSFALTLTYTATSL